MKVSTKGRYALRMLVDLAKHQGEGHVALKDIAARQHISKKYLEQIVPLLHSSEMLQASRGFQGGYRLARDPKEYTVASILRLTEGDIAPVVCLECGQHGCDFKDQCPTFTMWEGLYNLMSNYLEGITLQDLVDNRVKN